MQRLREALTGLGDHAGCAYKPKEKGRVIEIPSFGCVQKRKKS